MYISTKQVSRKFFRESKLGQPHSYTRQLTVVVLRCDNCSEVFERPKAKMETKRISDSYFHCCPKCDAKKFAQRKGVERRFIWDRPASSNDDISKI